MTVRPAVHLVASRRELARLAAATLDAAMAPPPASLGLALSDDAELAELNAEHMGEGGPTDVLSFPLLAPAAYPPHLGQDPDLHAGVAPLATQHSFALPPGRRLHLGDVVVSVERASAQAREGAGGHSGDVSWSVRDELRLLVVHGTLHVCGWDHAHADEEAAMRALERRILEETE